LVIVKSPLLAVLTCFQVSDVGSASEIACVVPVVSVSPNEVPLVTTYCRP
jgi:hypothetical protein